MDIPRFQTEKVELVLKYKLIQVCSEAEDIMNTSWYQINWLSLKRHMKNGGVPREL
jgi:hypothetical protein